MLWPSTTSVTDVLEERNCIPRVCQRYLLPQPIYISQFAGSSFYAPLYTPSIFPTNSSHTLASVDFIHYSFLYTGRGIYINQWQSIGNHHQRRRCNLRENFLIPFSILLVLEQMHNYIVHFFLHIKSVTEKPFWLSLVLAWRGYFGGLSSGSSPESNLHLPLVGSPITYHVIQKQLHVPQSFVNAGIGYLFPCFSQQTTINRMFPRHLLLPPTGHQQITR